jgi:hypothetical protein
MKILEKRPQALKPAFNVDAMLTTGQLTDRVMSSCKTSSACCGGNSTVKLDFLATRYQYNEFAKNKKGMTDRRRLSHAFLT